MHSVTDGAVGSNKTRRSTSGRRAQNEGLRTYTLVGTRRVNKCMFVHSKKQGAVGFREWWTPQQAGADVVPFCLGLAALQARTPRGAREDGFSGSCQSRNGTGKISQAPHSGNQLYFCLEHRAG